MSSAPAIEVPTRLSVDDARERIVELCGQRRVAVDEVALDRALGRVLAVDVTAPHALPPFANSAMDGYALRGEDLPREGEKRFRMAGAMLAGGGEALRVGTDECIRITTGAPLPIGADTVVVKERVRVDGGFVVVASGESRAANVRPAGEDLVAGESAARAGQVLSAARLGLLASCGFAKVPVARRPRVALLVTGDELVPTGEPLGFGQIHDSNRYTLGGLLEDIGIVAQPVAHVRDDVGALREALLAAAATCDVVISSGGVSAGEADHMPGLVAELGRVHFWKVRMKPGMPISVRRGGQGARICSSRKSGVFARDISDARETRFDRDAGRGRNTPTLVRADRDADPQETRSHGVPACTTRMRRRRSASRRRPSNNKAPACCAASRKRIVSLSSPKTRTSWPRAISWK